MNFEFFTRNFSRYVYILVILFFFWKKSENKKAFKHESNSSANADSLQSENDFLKNQLSKLQEAFKNEQQLISSKNRVLKKRRIARQSAKRFRRKTFNRN